MSKKDESKIVKGYRMKDGFADSFRKILGKKDATEFDLKLLTDEMNKTFVTKTGKACKNKNAAKHEAKNGLKFAKAFGYEISVERVVTEVVTISKK